MKNLNQVFNRKTLKSYLITAIIICCSYTNILAQWDSTYRPEPLKLNGPRLGFTYISPGETTDKLKENDKVPYVTQFGWQFENRFFTLSNGTSGLIEYVLLVGGLEQNIVLPSATMLFGLRTSKGLEFGAGPNLSLAGTGFAFACGFTLKSEYMYFPVNLAVVSSSTGVRFSVLFGFNTRSNK